jgi:hypothetical protein
MQARAIGGEVLAQLGDLVLALIEGLAHGSPHAAISLGTTKKLPEG